MRTSYGFGRRLTHSKTHAPALREPHGAWYANPMPAVILPLIEAVAHWPERGALVGLALRWQ